MVIVNDNLVLGYAIRQYLIHPVKNSYNGPPLWNLLILLLGVWGYESEPRKFLTLLTKTGCSHSDFSGFYTLLYGTFCGWYASIRIPVTIPSQPKLGLSEGAMCNKTMTSS